MAVARVAGHLGAVALAPVGHGLVAGLHRIAGEPVFPPIDDLRGTVGGRAGRRESLSPGESVAGRYILGVPLFAAEVSDSATAPG
ncbi:MAG: hypothetical protein ABF489_07620 [Bifidobacterium sp.]|uniref:hypothetical protein n=1 Tax=Bifidobacterium sp. TaxID=41200 RepID=UPI0039E92240